MNRQKIITVLEDLVFEDINQEDYWKAVKEAKIIIKELKQQCNIVNVVKSLPNDEEVKAYIDTLPYYGTCTTEYNEGFEDGVKWLKEKLVNSSKKTT